MTEDRRRVIRECIVEAASESGVLGAPSGVIYAALMNIGVDLDEYTEVLESLKNEGVVEEMFFLITLKEQQS